MPPVQTRLPPSSSPSSSPTSASRPRSGIMPIHPTTSSVSGPSSASSSGPYVRPAAPYMVALSGWPEPVYISNRSRPTTPRPSFPGEQGDGIILNSPTLTLPKLDRDRHGPETGTAPTSGVPAESIFSKTCMYNARQDGPCPVADHPNHIANHVERHSMARTPSSHDKHKHEYPAAGSSSFPTSSTRTPTHSPPLRPAAHPQYNATPSSRYGTFRDPRMAPNVGVLSNRAALPIAPGWTSSASVSSPPSHQNHQAQMSPLPNVGMKVPAGERGTGILVLRAVPDVYPPPMSHAMAGLPGMAGIAADMARAGSRQTGPAMRSLGVATEVYPRDPDSAFLWGSGAGVGRVAEEQAQERMEVDERGQW